MASRSDYKYQSVRVNNDGSVVVNVRFYEGEMVNRLRPDRNNSQRQVRTTEYERSAVLDFPARHFSTLPSAREDAAKKLWAADFRGTDDRDREFNVVLAEDTTRTPVDEQTRTTLTP